MGISCKYFISDFQKALDQADGKITQALNDLYNKYNQKAGQAESNLDNFLSTLKNEQKAADDLSMLIKQTNDYINTHNVVTRNEYDKLANEIVTKLGQINVTPNYYKNYDDMVANNPNGTENLCVTADTEHKWLYVNKQWLDLGNFSYAAIDPQLKMAMLTPNTSNVLPNSDFKLDDYWSAASSDGKEYTLENVIERFKSYNGSYYFKVFGDSTDAKVARWLLSSNFSVNGNAYMSIGLKGAVNSDGTNAYIVVHFIDKDKNEISQGTFLLDNSSAFKYFKFENIAIPANTVYISIGFVCKGTGIIEGTQPQVSFTKVLLPYSIADKTTNKLPQLRIYVDDVISSDWTNSRFTYVDGNKDLAGFVQIAWQGDSSKSYPKKNYKTKFFEDADFKKKMNWKPKASWANNNKFNLKANWIDATHARNLMNAKLFAKATAVTPFANADIAKKLSASQNFGQMEGFPIEVYINNDYQGLYTLNTKKDEKTFNMSDKIAGEEALEFENPLGADLTIDEKNVSTIVQDKPNDELQNNFTKFVKFINDSSDDDFKAHLQDYIDVKSVMNQYLFGVLAQEWDYYSKSYLLLTYNNGKYWYLTQYDLDSTWDIYWNGTQDPRETSFDLSAKELSGFVTGGSTLYSRVYKLFKQELQEQYKYLRSTVWRNDELIKPFKEFIDSIPSEVYKHDQTIWTNIPSKDFTSYGQLQSTILRRASEMDQFVNNTFEPIDTK